MESQSRLIEASPDTSKINVEKSHFNEANKRRTARISFKKFGKKGSQ